MCFANMTPASAAFYFLELWNSILLYFKLLFMKSTLQFLYSTNVANFVKRCIIDFTNNSE